MAVRPRVTAVFLFFSLRVFMEAELLYVCVRFAVPAELLF